MTKIYYRGAGAAIVCYGSSLPFAFIPLIHSDLTDAESFGRANFWMEELKTNVQNCLVYLVGCKRPPPSLPFSISHSPVDLIESGEKKRVITMEQVTNFAKGNGIKGVAETSSRSGRGVEELFHQIAQDWLQANPQGASLGASSRTLTPEQLQNEEGACSC